MEAVHVITTAALVILVLSIPIGILTRLAGCVVSSEIRHREVPSRYVNADGVFLDTWGNPFHVTADWSGDGTVKVGTNVVASPVAVWCNGKNGKDELGSGDDAISWEWK